jgi:alpha-D-ribose 1-methylphosphonate 5-triphosphate synthase subunit PhnH
MPARPASGALQVATVGVPARAISCNATCYCHFQIRKAHFALYQGEATMAEEKIPLNFHAHLRQEPDQSFTIVVEISGIPSVDMANRVSEWLQRAIRENAEMLDDVDTPPRRH